MTSFKVAIVSSVLFLSSTVSASAQQRYGWLADFWDRVIIWFNSGRHSHNSHHHNVPEIDASSGLLAVAAVLAALALTWEIKRRRS